jgi:hypothetical protein
MENLFMSSLAETLGSIPATVRPSEGAGTTTLTRDDNKWQVFNLSAARTLVLPTTGIKAGDLYRIENISASDLTIQSSNLSALTLANGANLEGTFRSGYCILIALQDAPTTPAHWRITNIYEEYVQTTISSNNFTSIAFRITRNNKSIVFSGTSDWSVTDNTLTQSSTAGLIPSRFRPVVTHRIRPAVSSGITFSITAAGTISVLGGPGGTSVDNPALAWNY